MKLMLFSHLDRATVVFRGGIVLMALGAGILLVSALGIAVNLWNAVRTAFGVCK